MGNTAWEKYDDAQLGMVEITARHYKEFLDADAYILNQAIKQTQM